MTMYSSTVNFPMISRALTVSMEALKNEQEPSESAFQKLKQAQDELQLALSFSTAEMK